jgi:diguanylate cyclase (GGDEF)-like protein
MHKEFIKHYNFDTPNVKVMNTLFWAATHDCLTESLNRFGFDLFVDMITDIAEPIEKYAYLSLVDIDGLSIINDLFGHKEGDEVIKKVAHTLMNSFHNGVTCRFGGDEFVVVALYGTTVNFGDVLGGVVRKISESFPDKQYPVNISYGYDYFSTKYNKRSMNEIFDTADKDMYSHKTSKRRSGNE